MNIPINGLPGSQIQNTGESSRVNSQGSTNESSAVSSAASGQGDDKVSLTSSATQLQQLTQQVSQLPVVDVERVTEVQRSVATGSFEFEPMVAADNMLTQERELAVLESQDIQK